MITIEFSHKEVDNTYTYELTCDATGGNPFVMDSDDTFLNIASPADMLLLPDTPGSSLYRVASITLIFRSESVRDLAENNIEEQIAELNSVNLSNQTGTVLYSNIP